MGKSVKALVFRTESGLIPTNELTGVVTTGSIYLIITFPRVAIKSAKSTQEIARSKIGIYLNLPTGLRSGRGIVKKMARQ